MPSAFLSSSCHRLNAPLHCVVAVLLMMLCSCCLFLGRAWMPVSLLQAERNALVGTMTWAYAFAAARGLLLWEPLLRLLEALCSCWAR